MTKRPRRNHTAAFKARRFKAKPTPAAPMGEKILALTDGAPSAGGCEIASLMFFIKGPVR